MCEQPTSEKPGSATAGAGRRWRWLGPLLAVHAAAALLTLWSMRSDPLGDFHEILVVSVVFAQGSLLGIWAALGGRPLPWRLLAATAAFVALMRLLENAGDMQVWAWFVLLEMMLTCLPLLALRLGGLQLATFLPPNPRAQTARMQFSLGSLLAWTTATAALLGAFKMTSQDFRNLLGDGGQLIEVFVVLGGVALLSLAGLWLSLGARWMAVRVPAAVLAVAVLSLGMWCMEAPQEVEWIILFPLLCGAWLIGSLLVLRFAGYRLVWRRTARTQRLCENAPSPPGRGLG